MRSRLLRSLGLGVGLGLGALATSLAFAGPNADRRAAYFQSEAPREDSQAAARLLREVRAIVAGCFGESGSRGAVETIAEPARFEERARAAGEADATVFADFERGTLVVQDGVPDRGPERARIIVHEAAKLELARLLGGRPAPWLEEGLACCVEDAWAQGADLGSERPDPDRAARARIELRGRASMERLLALSPPAFARGERVHRDVALAWVAARHLLQGGARARRALAACTETLRASHSPDRAARALASALPPADLERALAVYAR